MNIDQMLRTFAGVAARSVLNRAPHQYQLSLFKELARRLQIDAASVAGRNGTMFGYIRDDVVFTTYLRTGHWNWDAVAYILNILKGTGTFIDVGANIGMYSVPAARGLTKVIAFEPDPSNFRMLNLNVQANGCKNVTLHNVALSSEPGILAFELSPHNMADHRIRRPTSTHALMGEESRTVVSVPARRLDDMVHTDALQVPIVIKMDVQGAEPLVMEGGRSIFDRADVLMTEFWPYGIRRLGVDPVRYAEDLTRMFPYGVVVNADLNQMTVNFNEAANCLPILREAAARNDDKYVDILLSRASALS